MHGFTRADYDIGGELSTNVKMHFIEIDRRASYRLKSLLVYVLDYTLPGLTRV